MAKSKKESNNTPRSKELGKIVTLTKKETEAMEITPQLEGKEIFEKLAIWRNRSLASDIRI